LRPATLAITLALLQNSEPRVSATKCDVIHYGIGRPPDLAKAYECYASDGDFEMQIVMILNGDGMPQDPRRVEALFIEWSKHDNWQATSSAQAKALREALVSLRAGRLNKHLDFCESIASDTLAGLRCDSLRTLTRETELNHLLDNTAKTLQPSQRAAFVTLRETFRTFLNAEGARGGQLFIRGTIRHTAGSLLEDHIREHFVRT
jgi:hypothetical protein